MSTASAETMEAARGANPNFDAFIERFGEGPDRWPDVVFSRLIELIDEQKSSGESGPLAFCVTKEWLEDGAGASLADGLAYLRAKCPDERIAIGVSDSAGHILVVLHTNGREASEAELVAALNPKEPDHEASQ